MKTELANYLNAETEKERANRTPSKAQPDTARHSPLPWGYESLGLVTCNGAQDVVARTGGHSQRHEADARLIVRAVNNAGKLAEALREIAVRLDGQVRRASNDRTVTESEKIAREALADYERSAQ